jgi:NodT family efflux transporter outer membrane factor (OMF) lipoprotein
MRQRLISIAICLLAAGCAVGPDFKRPQPPAVEGYRPTTTSLPNDSDAPNFVQGAEIPNAWWESFNSPPLNALVERALKANPNIDATRAALRSAQESAAAQRGAFWPQVTASLTPTRQKIADSLNSPLNSPVNPFSLHTAQVSVAYAPDVFGGNRRLTESLEAQAEVQGFELEAARLSLAANVVVAAFTEASLRSQIATTEKSIELDTEMLALARRQLALGANSAAGVAAQEATLAQARATLPPLKKQLAQTRDLLIALTGGLPDKDLEQRFELAELHLPQDLPVSLPSRLVEHRPDIRAAEAQAHAAAAQIGVAFANRLPQFTLSANGGSVASALTDLVKAGNGFWEIAGAISQPIFAGGTLAHRQAAAEAAYDQAMSQYRATVVAAFQNVADVLYALEQDTDALHAADAAAQATAHSLAISRRQVELGDISHLAMLNAAQADLQAQIALIQAQVNRLADTAALFQALGGGRQAEQETETCCTSDSGSKATSLIRQFDFFRVSQ